MPDPTWGNHHNIFRQVGLPTTTYKYYDGNNGFDYEGMLASIAEAPEGSIFLLHACAHNPTGIDPSMEQWKGISDALKAGNHFPFFDCAYQGFASGNADTDAAAVARMAGVCDLPTTLEQAQLAIANLAAESTTFDDLAEAAHELALTVRYGDVRRFSVEPLLPLVEQLFREAALHMMGSANCDDGTALGYLEAIHHLNRISQELSELVDEALWEKELMALSNSDAHNPILSGFACALLLERGAIDDDELATELARRLSPGIDADLGAGWFEGLSKRNRYALLSRLSLWRHLEEYIGALEPDEFKRALVFLRRAFESFSAHERRQIAENLGEVWGVHGETASELVEAPLDEEEEKALDELSDFDFGDLGDL